MWLVSSNLIWRRRKRKLKKTIFRFQKLVNGFFRQSRRQEHCIQKTEIQIWEQGSVSLSPIWWIANVVDLGVGCLSRSLDLCVCVGMLRLQCEESDMGICHIRCFPLHRLLSYSSQSRCSYQLRQVTLSILHHLMALIGLDRHGHSGRVISGPNSSGLRHLDLTSSLNKFGRLFLSRFRFKLGSKPSIAGFGQSGMNHFLKKITHT